MNSFIAFVAFTMAISQFMMVKGKLMRLTICNDGGVRFSPD